MIMSSGTDLKPFVKVKHKRGQVYELIDTSWYKEELALKNAKNDKIEPSGLEKVENGV